jgi:glycosyltransferase involved in cell wall biosynthesis/GT2 family glycosyltransferase
MSKVKIAFLDTIGLTYEGDSLQNKGLGGSESAIILISKELSKLNFEVTVFNRCDSPGFYDNVEYKDWRNLEENENFFDILITSRNSLPLVPIENQNEILENYDFDITPFQSIVQKSKYKILWLHDTFVLGEDWVEPLTRDGIIDEIFTLSDYHTNYIVNSNHENVIRSYEVLKDKLFQTRNGVYNFKSEIDINAKDKNLFIYNASATKGLWPLLNQIWPRLKLKIPNAKLTVIGGYYDLGEEYDEIKELYKEMVEKYKDDSSVVFTGIITLSEISKILEKASFFIYPGSYPETFGISATEALFHNVPVIGTRFGALEETAPESTSYLIDYPITRDYELYHRLKSTAEEWQIIEFLNTVEYAYSNDYVRQQKMYAANEFKPFLGWDTVALQWKHHFYKKINMFMPLDEIRESRYRTHRLLSLYNRRFVNEEDKIEDYSTIEKNDIIVISPVFNAENYIENHILSIANQNYEQYHHIIIDDCSTDNTYSIALNLINSFPNEIKQGFTLIKNTEKKYALGNQLFALNEITGNPIIVLLDGDDWLVNDIDIFNFINREYTNGIKFTYGSCYSIADNINLIAQDYPISVKESKKYREHKFTWGMPYTHLRTFKKELFDLCDKEDFLDENGIPWRAGGDNSLFYSLIEKCEPFEVKAIQKILVNYNDINPLNDYKVNSEEQEINKEKITNQKNNKDINILIATPTDKYIEAETFRSIYNLKIPKNVNVDFNYFFGYRIDQIRNLIAHVAIRDKYDYVLFLDSDIIMPKDTLNKMLELQKEIVTGIYVQRNPNKKITEVHMNGKNITDLEFFKGKKYIEADSSGFGCILVKTKVLEEVGYPQFEYHPALTIEDTFSEDADFCVKARKLGYTINVLTDLHFDHIGKTKWSL